MSRTTARALPVLVLAFALSASSAQAAERWTSPTSTVTSGACAQSSPCRIDAAVNGAASGDEVIVPPGTYSVAQPLSPTAAIHVHGVAGEKRPRLVGASNLVSSLLSVKTGGTLRHLWLEATAPGQDALTLQRGVAEDLLLLSASGDGGKVVGASPATVLRDSVVRTNATGSGSAGLKLRESGGAGDVALVNVTVMAPGSGAAGVRCEVRNGQARIVNTIARGAAGDIDGSSAVGHCTATASNFRAALSPGLTSGGGNQSAEPRFVDAAGADYRPVADSVTVDAGQGDLLLGAAGAGGCAHTLGLGPDMGAYEYGCPTAEAEPLVPTRLPAGGSGLDADLRAQLAGVPAPAIGTTVVTAPSRGTVRIRRPGASRFTRLGAAARIPVGTVIDATAGRLRLVSAIDSAGTLQAGTFWGSRFQVRQSRTGDGTTSLVLRGGDFGKCRTRSTRRLATVSRKRKAKTVRSLWAKDRHGRFRTQGENSVATARGTAWLTRDRCDGTYIRVTAGAVSVRARGASKSVLVKAGRSHLARRKR